MEIYTISTIIKFAPHAHISIKGPFILRVRIRLYVSKRIVIFTRQYYQSGSKCEILKQLNANIYIKGTFPRRSDFAP